VPTPREDLEKELASHPDRVLVLAGAGVACATDKNPCAYWSGLLKDGLKRCRERCHNLSPDWATITELSIKQNTADELIQAASRIEKALRGVHNGEYSRWLTDSVGALKLNDRRTVDAILSWKTRVATTNYDNLFENASGLQPVVWDQGHLALQVLRGDQPGILHLHGHYLYADTVIFGAKTYEDICRDAHAQNLLRSVFTRDTIVFVGCGAGVDDPNFGGLFEWSKEELGSCLHTHYHLVRESEREAVTKQYQGLRVTLVVYGKDYSDLGPFLEQVSERVCRQDRLPIPLGSLVTRQTDYESQRRELDARSDLSPLEYVRRSFELARSLWDAGGQ
jgi:NAD-dependent SIR2 family protein deacetylase